MWRNFGCHNRGEGRCAAGTSYAEARYGALHPTTLTGQHPTTKKYLTQNAISGTVEESQHKVSLTIEQSLYQAHIKDDKNNLVAVISN